MTIDEDRDRAGHISGLVGNHGYQYLIQDLKALDQAMIAELADCRDAATLLYRSRFWQAFHKIVDILATEPSRCAAIIEHLAEMDAKQMMLGDLDTLTHHSDSLY